MLYQVELDYQNEHAMLVISLTITMHYSTIMPKYFTMTPLMEKPISHDNCASQYMT